MRFNSAVTDIIESPISSTFAHLPNRAGRRELLDLSQAAPSYPTAPVIAERIAAVAAEPDGGRYAPSLGLPKLREVFASELSTDYRGAVGPENVLITAGCNQAFCVAASALAGPGDEIILCVPYYFNHAMWCEAEGIKVVTLQTGADGQPDPERAASLITANTRALLLVTPGNPTGVTVDPERIAAFHQLAVEHGIALMVDETYRNFRATTEPAHQLFADAGWQENVISLHSFSKDLAIPGYRVGALVASPQVITESAKLLDCVAISAPRVGQEAAITGLGEAGAWRAEQAARIEISHQAFRSTMEAEPGGFRLMSSGAYFGWLRHPFDDLETAEVVRRLIVDHDVLVIPGTAFTPADQHMLRFSFANLAPESFGDLADRLTQTGA